MSHRIFIGIRPPTSIRDAMIDVMEGAENARWQSDEQLHLTLRFIGTVETPLANDLAAALGGIKAKPFDIHAAGIGTFEHKGRPHAIWARIPPTAPLERLRQKIERACEAVGIPRDTRRFTPHITLARLNKASGVIGPWLTKHAAFRTESWPVSEFLLYESHLGAGGSHYEPVASYPLR